MSGIDESEIVRALSLEEKALNEFRRRKDSNNQTEGTSCKTSHPVGSNFNQKKEEDLISFASHSDELKINNKLVAADDTYNRLKQSILKINSATPNIQPILYNNNNALSITNLTPEGLSSLYNVNYSNNVMGSNQFYNQSMRFKNSQYTSLMPSTSSSQYPAIGFGNFLQQSNLSHFQSNFSVHPKKWFPSDAMPKANAMAADIPSKHIQQLPIQSNVSKRKISVAPPIGTSKHLDPPAASKNTTIASSNPSLKSDNLIDLDVDDSGLSVILDTFDPLVSSNRLSAEDPDNSYYSDYDPFDYIYSGGTQCSDPVYEAVIKSDRSVSSPKPQTAGEIAEYNLFNHPQIDATNDQKPPPLPPRNSNIKDSQQSDSGLSSSQQQYVSHYSKKLYENIIHRKSYDRDLIAFYTMVKELRSKYAWNDDKSNIGHIVAAQFDNKYMKETSIKLLVYPSLECYKSRELHTQHQLEGYANPVIFTCDVNSTVEHVIMHVLVVLEREISGAAENYAVKTIGSQEWFSPNACLSHLEYIHDCVKLEKDIQLGLFPKLEKYMKVIARTKQDDIRDAEIKLENILPKEPISSISHDSLMILLETFEMEIDKLESFASDSNIHTPLHSSGVVQAVKAICALLGCIDTLELFDAINNLKEACHSYPPNQIYKIHQSTASIYSKPTVSIVSEKGDYAQVRMRPRKINEDIKYHCDEVRDAVSHLLEMFAQAFQVNFTVRVPQWNTAPISVTNALQNIIVHIVGLHRPPASWKHDEYMLGVQIYHGTRFIGEPMVTHCSNSTDGFYPRLTFNTWMNFEDVPVCTLPRESRLVFVVYGCVKEPVDGGQSSNDSSQGNENRVTKIELCWSSIQFFDFERKMIQGTYLLSLWPPSADKYFCPSPSRGTHPLGDYCPILSIEIPSYGCGQLVFPEIELNGAELPMMDFESLDNNLQEELLDTIDQGFTNTKLDKREVLWEKRHYLHSFPKALPKVLNAAHTWDYASLSNLHTLLQSWTPLEPLEAIELLLPRYPDTFVRAQAVKWISKMSHDELIDYLPQLLQALKHDCYEASALSCFLLGRALDSPRVAHYLYWLLVQNLPGDCPQNTTDINPNYDDDYVLQSRYHRRNQLILRALLAICGEKLAGRFLAQNIMCKALDDVARSVKIAKESLKLPILRQNIENVHQILLENPTSLPLTPSLEVTGINSRTCNYFNSNTLPLKINFIGPDNLLIPAIFKLGDDLQQDMLTLQMVRIMDKMWLKEGLDLKMVTFQCIPTGDKKGMIEMITNAETLRKIQVEFGLTGSFKDKPIAEWLAKQNASQLEYQRAVDNFTASCAGYSIVTYLLGICDRHNDNIMLKKTGHLFHIDFGKFLGDAQRFGNFKRDRVPFVLSPDMLFVINGQDRPSEKFHNFVDLCCRAFNIVRKHGDLILHMFALMASSGIQGVNGDAVNYVRNALMPSISNPEASASFARMIHVSLKSWFTQFNFFLHNLAQMRFSGDAQDGELLSFIPKTYTVSQDGRIENVVVHGYQKRYDLEKYYTYILIVFRQTQPDPAYLFRSYKEFCELHQKLCLLFPLAKFHSLQTGILVGRSHVKTVAEKRLPEVKKFVRSLLQSTPEILNSDLVVTFFHPLLRDQQEADIHTKKMKENRQQPEPNIAGEIKFSIHYHRGTFIVMIHHARSLPLTTGSQEPNTYVKCYLMPDRSKITKRKTKVVRKSCYPSFMETLEYRMPMQAIRLKTLQVTVWGHDSLQENEFLGGVQLPLNNLNLKEEIVGWYRLSYLTRQ